MALDDASERDYEEEVKGIHFVIDNSLQERVGEIKIDYRSGLLWQGYFVTASNKGCF